MHKVIIFGGTGFIGSHLCELLLKKKRDVYICSRNKPDNYFWLSRKRLKQKAINHMVCDISSQQQILNILFKLKPLQVVFCAGENPTNTPQPDSRYISGNVINSYNFLSACDVYFKQLSSKDGLKFKILNVSSYEIYDNNHIKNERRIWPKTIYSASKATSFHLFNAWKNTYGLPIVSAVCANNFGKNQGKDKLIPMTINNIINNQKIHLFQNGQCVRNWIHVNDTAAALALVLESGSIGRTYNIASDNVMSNKELVFKIINLLANHTEKNLVGMKRLIMLDGNTNTTANSHDCNYDQLVSEFGWLPSISMEEGLLECIHSKK